jgi:hypothetical protein
LPGRRRPAAQRSPVGYRLPACPVGRPDRSRESHWGRRVEEVAGDRGDLLAEVAGLVLGSATGRGPEYEARRQAVAELYRMAGAGEALIPQWIEEDRRRAEAAQLPPFTRPGRAPRRPRTHLASRASGAGPGRPMVPMPPRSPTAFAITRGRYPGPYTTLPGMQAGPGSASPAASGPALLLQGGTHIPEPRTGPTASGLRAARGWRRPEL